MDGGLKANALAPGIVQRRGCSRCTIAVVVLPAPGRSSHGLSTGIRTPLLVCGAPAMKFCPSISMMVSISGCFSRTARTWSATCMVRSSGLPGGSW